MYTLYVFLDAGPKKVMTYEGKGSFGELALLYNMPRAATVQVNGLAKSLQFRKFDLDLLYIHLGEAAM